MTTEKTITGIPRVDSWLNDWFGFGDVMRDALRSAAPGTNDVELATLDVQFDNDWATNKGVSAPVQDGMRKAFSVAIDPEGEDDSAQQSVREMSQKIDDALLKLEAYDRIAEAATWARLQGGALIVLGVPGVTELLEPMNEANIPSIEFLNVIRRDKLTAVEFYDNPLEAKFGQVKVWQFRGNAQTTYSFHESWAILFRGELTTPDKRVENGGWDQSVAQRAFATMQRNGMAWQALAHLLVKSNILTFALNGFTEMTRGLGKALDAFRNRMRMQRMASSVNSWIAYDAKDEKIDNVAVSFAGVSDAMDRIMMEVSGAWGAPVTKFWGRSPAGENATGESDLQLWDQEVANFQQDKLDAPCRRLVRLLMLSKAGPTEGVEPKSWSLEWASIRAMTEAQRGALQLIVCQFLALLVTNEIALPEEVALSEFFAEGGILSELQLDQESRRSMLEDIMEAERERRLSPPTPPPVQPPPLQQGPDDQDPPEDAPEDGNGDG